MILPDPNQSTDIPVEIPSESPHIPHPYFRQLTAIISVFVLTAGLGLAVKLAQNRQNPFSRANTAPIERLDLSVKTLGGSSLYPRYGLSVTAIGSQGSVDEASFQWGVSSTNSIGTLDIHSSQKYAEFSLNGNEGRADIWIITNGGIKTSYPITFRRNATLSLSPTLSVISAGQTVTHIINLNTAGVPISMFGFRLNYPLLPVLTVKPEFNSMAGPVLSKQ